VNDYVLFLLIALVLFFTLVPYSVQRILELRQANRHSPMSPTVEKVFMEGIHILVHKGKLVEAIEAYRDYYQVDHAEAKSAITKIQHSQQSDSESSITRNAAGSIIKLVKQGKIQVAISVYQEVTGADLETAQKAIAQIQHSDLSKL